MAKVYFEEKLVSFIEEKKVVDSSASRQGTKINESITIEYSVTSPVFEYDDGLELYLTFNRLGLVDRIIPVIHFKGTDIRKKLVSVPYDCELSIKRTSKFTFLITVHERANESGNACFVNFKNINNIREVKVHYTKLLQKEIIDGKYVILNCFEKISDTNKFHTIVIFDILGTQLDVVVDENKSLNEFFYYNYHKLGGKYEIEVYKTEAFKDNSIKYLTHKFKG